MCIRDRCQQLCAAHPNCDFFSYEYELLEPEADGLYGHECFLKAAYVGCTDDDPMAGYGVWTATTLGGSATRAPRSAPAPRRRRLTARAC